MQSGDTILVTLGLVCSPINGSFKEMHVGLLATNTQSRCGVIIGYQRLMPTSFYIVEKMKLIMT